MIVTVHLEFPSYEDMNVSSYIFFYHYSADMVTFFEPLFASGHVIFPFPNLLVMPTIHYLSTITPLAYASFNTRP